MKLGTENKTKTWVATALGVLALYFAVTRLPAMFSAPPPQPAAATAVETGVAAPQPQRKKIARRGGSVAVLSPTLDPRLRLDLLKTSETTEYTGSGRNIFRAEAEP